MSRRKSRFLHSSTAQTTDAVCTLLGLLQMRMHAPQRCRAGGLAVVVLVVCGGCMEVRAVSRWLCTVAAL
jgi:hypothetical protein